MMLNLFSYVFMCVNNCHLNVFFNKVPLKVPFKKALKPLAALLKLFLKKTLTDLWNSFYILDLLYSGSLFWDICSAISLTVWFAFMLFMVSWGEVLNKIWFISVPCTAYALHVLLQKSFRVLSGHEGIPLCGPLDVSMICLSCLLLQSLWNLILW